MMKHNSKRLAAAAMSLVLTVSSAAPALAAGPSYSVGDGRTPSCDEAYYATLDYYGNLTDGSVVKSYVLNGATSIVDYGEYDSVENLTDSTAPTKDAKSVSFDFGSASPTHFYFQGKTSKPYTDLPWKLSISYKLNGVPAKAEDLAGKTGVVEIDVDAIPNKSVSDYARHNYTLETMALFNQDDILSLEAPGAQVQLLGNLRAVLFVAFPGEEGHYAIRVGAENFEFGGMTFLMVPATLSQLEEISKLAQRKDDLESSYKNLSESLDALLDSIDSVSGSLYASASGLDALNAARGTVSAGKGGVYAAADRALNDLDTMAASLAPLSSDLSSATTALSAANTMLADMTATTAALRSDLNQMSSILSDAQGSKDDLLAVMADVSRLQTKLQYAASSLGSIGGTSVASVGVSSQQLQSAKALHDAYGKAAGSAGTLTEDAFINTVLAMKGSDKTAADLQSTEAYGETKEAVYLNVYKTAYRGALKSTLAGKVPDAAMEAIDAIDGADAATFQNTAAGTLQAFGLPAEQIAALTAGADKFAAEKAAEAATGFATYQQLKQVYAAGVQGNMDKNNRETMDFAGFLTALSAASSNATEKESLNKLLAMYRENPYAVLEMITDPSSLAASMDDINRDIMSINALLGKVGSTGASANLLLQDLAGFCGDITALRPLVEDADSLAALAASDSALLAGTLASVEQLQTTLDAYQPELSRAASELMTAGEQLSAASSDTSAFLHSAEDLLQSAGSQLDDATKQSLANLASALRSTAAALEKGDSVRAAKDTISGMVEDTWKDYTGDINDLLEIDANADAVSLTDSRNPSPASVQVLIRTQEIKAPKTSAGADASSAVVTVPAQTQETASDSNFFSRIGDMFSNIWASIIGFFRR